MVRAIAMVLCKAPVTSLPLNMLTTRYICSTCRKALQPGLVKQPVYRPLHASTTLYLPHRRDFFSSNAALRLPVQASGDGKEEPKQKEESTAHTQKRKTRRSPTAGTSLKRVAIEAQRSRDGKQQKPRVTDSGIQAQKLVTAYAVAEQFNLRSVVDIVREKGYEPDPLNTRLYPQVVHIQVPMSSLSRSSNPSAKDLSADEIGDIFIFPSGTVVTWALPEGFTSFFAQKTLLPAAINPQNDQTETEDLEFIEDPAKEHSIIRGDTITLGTRKGTTTPDDSRESVQQTVDTVLTKIAISSGFARSTKLAVLESLLSSYFETTRSIPERLSRGSRLPFTRAFILQKTGELLNLRAQLNLYSELTDSLPDLLWDSREELRLEGYYDQIGSALDVNVRIRILNQKMDYAQEIAGVLREQLSERHGLFLEWTIIALIAIEVGFELLNLWKEHKRELLAKELPAGVS